MNFNRIIVLIVLSSVITTVMAKGMHSRCEVLGCVQHFVDFNKDGLISKEEMTCAREAYLPSYLGFLEWGMKKLLKSEVEDNSVIMQKCDMDKDGYISEWDFYNSSNTCLHLQVKLELGNNIFCNEAAEKWHHLNIVPGDMKTARKKGYPPCAKTLWDIKVDPANLGPLAFNHLYKIESDGTITRLDGLDCFSFDQSPEWVKKALLSI